MIFSIIFEVRHNYEPHISTKLYSKIQQLFVIIKNNIKRKRENQYKELDQTYKKEKNNIKK